MPKKQSHIHQSNIGIKFKVNWKKLDKINWKIFYFMHFQWKPLPASMEIPECWRNKITRYPLCINIGECIFRHLWIHQKQYIVYRNIYYLHLVIIPQKYRLPICLSNFSKLHWKSSNVSKYPAIVKWMYISI